MLEVIGASMIKHFQGEITDNAIYIVFVKFFLIGFLNPLNS